MEQAIDKLSTDIQEFILKLQEKRKTYEDALSQDEVLHKTKQILKEIKELEKAIVSAVEKHFQIANKKIA